MQGRLSLQLDEGFAKQREATQPRLDSVQAMEYVTYEPEIFDILMDSKDKLTMGFHKVELSPHYDTQTPALKRSLKAIS